MTNKILKYSLIVIFILSLLINLWLLMTIGYISIEYEDSCYLDNLEWCEISNDLSGLVNDLLYQLEYYDDGYYEVERLDIIDCFNSEEMEVKNEIIN